MTSLQAVAHSAHQTLLPLAPNKLKHSHVYELLAAAFGFRSWAALRADHVFVDFDQPRTPKPSAPLIVGRSLQLGFSQDESARLAGLVMQTIDRAALHIASLIELDEKIAFVPDSSEDDHDFEDWDDDPEEAEEQIHAKARFKQSSLLLSQLEQRATSGDMKSHYRLALLLECKIPPDYLYQESLRGRILNATEQAWVDNYLLAVPRFERFLKHLKAAADGGIRAAALLYSSVANDAAYRVKAEQMDGEVEPLSMAKTATEPASRKQWLWAAANQGHPGALDMLAADGDQDAMEQLAARGDGRQLQRLLEDALEHRDHIAAWKWHFVGLGHGYDMTQSTLHAFHDGGARDGQFYDSDFGGPLGVGGDEGIELPDISNNDKSIAMAEAQVLVERLNR